MAVCVFWIEAGISMRDLGQPNISLSLDFKVLLKPVWSEKGAKNFHIGYLLISVRSWNFKDGGSLKASFFAKNQHGTKEKSLKKSYN